MELPVELYLEIVQYSSKVWRLLRQTNKHWLAKLVPTGFDRFYSSRAVGSLAPYSCTTWIRGTGSVEVDESVWHFFLRKRGYYLRRRVGIISLGIDFRPPFVGIIVCHRSMLVFRYEGNGGVLGCWPQLQGTAFTSEAIGLLLNGSL